MDPVTLSRPLTTFNLFPTALNLLESAGVFTVGDLIRFSEDELNAIRMMNSGMVRQLKVMLEELHLTLRTPGSPSLPEVFMPVVPPFQMSDATKQELKKALSPLSPLQLSVALDAIASLAAEMEIHLRQKALEQLRQGWAESLRTMLIHDPKPLKRVTT